MAARIAKIAMEIEDAGAQVTFDDPDPEGEHLSVSDSGRSWILTVHLSSL